MPEYKLRFLLYVRLVSSAYGFILPGQLATEGIRAYLLGKDEKNYGQSTAVVALDKLIAVIALLVLGFIGLVLTNSIGYWLAGIFAFCSFILSLLLFSLNVSFFFSKMKIIFHFLSKKAGRFGKLFNIMIQMIEHWKLYTHKKILIIKSFLYGLFFQLSFASIGALLSYGVGAGFNILDWLWIHTLLAFVLMIPFSLGGLGIREGSLIGLLGLIGVLPEQALAISFAFLAINIIQALVGIGLELFHNYIRIAEKTTTHQILGKTNECDELSARKTKKS